MHRRFGPYFTDAYRTPWGQAINFDGPGSDGVRRYFFENARSWLERFHVDALRLDAVHGIYDRSAVPFLEELAVEIDALAAGTGRLLHIIAESALNDPRLVGDLRRGGLGLHAQWNDELHHALYAYLTGERGGHLADFGSLADVATAYKEGFVVNGRYSSFHDRHFGASSRGVPAERLVVFAQNHDQVGNRRGSARLASDRSFEELKLLAGAVVLSPYVPLLFMGEEYGETAPFPYFISHSDRELVRPSRRGAGESWRPTSARPTAPTRRPDPPSPRPAWTALCSRRRATPASALARCGASTVICWSCGARCPACGRPADGLVVLPAEEAEALLLLRATRNGLALVVLALGAEARPLTVPAGYRPVRAGPGLRRSGVVGPGSDLPGTAQAGDVLRPAPRSVALFTGQAPHPAAP